MKETKASLTRYASWAAIAWIANPSAKHFLGRKLFGFGF